MTKPRTVSARLFEPGYLARWVAALAVVAAGAGTIAAAFLWALDEAAMLRFEFRWLVLAMPVAGLAMVAVYQRYGGEANRGNNLVVARLHEPANGVPIRIVPLIFAGTVLSHLVGASVGREGTAVQMGAGVASSINRWAHFRDGELRILLMAGVAGGFGAVFGTPIAGAIFAAEVIHVRRFEVRGFIPALACALGADLVARAWGAHHTHYHVLDPGIDAGIAARVVIAAVAFGLCALLFAELLRRYGQLLRRLVPWPLAQPVVGAALILALAAALGTREYLGLGTLAETPGDITLSSMFAAGGADPLSWWWKLAFTVIAVGSGFKGGEVTPLFFMGAALGNLSADVMGGPVDVMAAVGFVAVFGAAAKTPFACAVMGMELFGLALAPYLLLGCGIAWVVSGRWGIYTRHADTAKRYG